MKDPRILYVPVCEPCLHAEGEVCHTPGCIFIRHRTPAEWPIDDLASYSETPAVKLSSQEAADRFSILLENFLQDMDKVPAYPVDYLDALQTAAMTLEDCVADYEAEISPDLGASKAVPLPPDFKPIKAIKFSKPEQQS